MNLALLVALIALLATPAALGQVRAPDQNPLGCVHVRYPKFAADLNSRHLGQEPVQTLRAERRASERACRRCCRREQHLPFYNFRLEASNFYACRCLGLAMRLLGPFSG